MKVTADTITDEQIRELRDSALRPPGCRDRKDLREIRFQCALAMSSCMECERGRSWVDDQTPCANCDAWSARARCADLINTEAK